MNIAEASLKYKTLTWTFTILAVVLGVVVFPNMSRLEDPEFTIKDAIITTRYPGASAEEVELEVSDRLEIAVQELGQLKRVESTSTRGVSSLKAKIKDQYDKESLPQVWDELRRKVTDAQVRLPPGAGPSLVNDDFGDVFGMYYAITGEGYSLAEIKEYAKLLRRELLLVQDVKKVVLWGDVTETIYVEMSRPKMAALGISQEQIYDALASKNLAADGGRLSLGPDRIPISPTGEFTSETQFGELLVASQESGNLIFLRDVAEIQRGYQDPPNALLRYDGKPAIALGISTVAGGNVVAMGEAIDARLRQLEVQRPIGMDIEVISHMANAVTESVNGFVVNLLQAVVIVIVVLLFFMGLKAGLIIGGVLALTISGTLFLMSFNQVVLERISLGALIIALGMLVDNAIVVVDGMQVLMKKGRSSLEAAKEVVGKNAVPLLGATAIAATAFASISTSEDSTGEYTRSLFTVVMYALLFSWVTAVTSTPLLVDAFIKSSPPKEGNGEEEAYGGKFFNGYRALLRFLIRRRWAFAGAVAALVVFSGMSFGLVKQMFFPDSTRPQFFVEYFFPSGQDIRTTETRIADAEEYLDDLDGVTNVSATIGGGGLRFLLTYDPVPASPGNAATFVDVDDWRVIEGLVGDVQTKLEELLPDAVINVKKFRLGPGEGGRIQLRISGPDRVKVRQLADRAKRVIKSQGAIGVRDEWKDPVLVVRPQMAEAQSQRLGIDRPMVARSIQSAFDGYQTGVYREGDELLPIVARAPEFERTNVDNLNDLQIWSPVAGRMIPIGQVLYGFETTTEDETIWRFNRIATQRVHADPQHGDLPADLLARVKPLVERELGVDVNAYFDRPDTGDDPLETLTATTIPIRDQDQIPLVGESGYFIAWGGEAEDSSRAQASLAVAIPVFTAVMFLITLFLFRTMKPTLVIWLSVPLAMIGITFGLLLTDQPFGFMALLGGLSLVGMMIKNAIVLVEEIQNQVAERANPLDGVIEASVSRLRPVMMAAATTILGMIPLLTDAFFVAMAVAIMFGLLVASPLMMLFIPVLYAIFFKIPNEPGAEVDRSGDGGSPDAEQPAMA